MARRHDAPESRPTHASRSSRSGELQVHPSLGNHEPPEHRTNELITSGEQGARPRRARSTSRVAKSLEMTLSTAVNLTHAADANSAPAMHAVRAAWTSPSAYFGPAASGSSRRDVRLRPVLESAAQRADCVREHRCHSPALLGARCPTFASSNVQRDRREGIIEVPVLAHLPARDSKQSRKSSRAWCDVRPRSLGTPPTACSCG
jgi:hypothetical protein